jgi:hypothetical protein
VENDIILGGNKFMLQEKTSLHLGVPYVYLPDKQQFLCSNGVAFTLAEYRDGLDLNEEYEKRKVNGTLYDYQYAKTTGLLRRKRSDSARKDDREIAGTEEAVVVDSDSQITDSREVPRLPCSVFILSIALLLTSFGCMYISTIHTATYLFDYVDKVSAWVMSTVITIYCSCAFEVAVLFKDTRRYVLSTLVCFLWVLVLLFSMATTVSVFYDRFNFNTVQTEQATSEEDSKRVILETLKSKEMSLREAIAEKKADMEYRRSVNYATTAVRTEMNVLQKELSACLDEQMKVINETPTAVKGSDEVKRKESLFAFLGRKMNTDGGILEFIMSTLTAIFVNLISPITVTIATTFLGNIKKEIKE